MVNITLWQNVFVIIINIIGCLLLFLVITAKEKRLLRFFFIIATLSMFGWVNFAHLSRIIVIPSLRLNLLRIAWFMTPMLLLTIYYFSLLLTKRFSKSSRQITFITLLTLLVSLLAGFSNSIVNNYEIINGALRIVYGDFMIPFLLSLLLIMIMTVLPIILTYRNRKHHSSLELRQIHPYTLGLITFYTLNTIFNIILPVFLNYTRLYYFGDYSTIVILLSVAYSIIRFQFMDVRILFGRIFYYLILAAVPYFAFYFIVAGVEALVGEVFNVTTYFVTIPIAVAFVLFYERLNNFLKYQVTTRLINPGYNAAEAAERYTAQINLILDLPTLTEKFHNLINQTIRPDRTTVVLLQDRERGVSEQVFNSDDQPIGNIGNLVHKVITLWMATGVHPVIQDEIEYEMERGRYVNLKPLAIDLISLMNSAEVKVVMAISTKDKVKGVYLFGQKESDYPYTSIDLDFAATISNSTSVAIERALLYAEVQDFADTLQVKVDKATANLKTANAKLQAALTQVQEARRRERDMMDVMGHELRTPISIVRNSLAMLEREASKTEDNSIPPQILNKYISMGLESARREITLIETLLSATKVDASRLQLSLTKVDFQDVMQDGIEGQKFKLAQKSLVLKYLEPQQHIYVYCDRTRVQEIMDNFLSNAVKYTMKGEIYINTWQDNQFGYISIKDTGIGVGEEDLKNLGKKFFRAKQYIGGGDDTQVVRPGGTGLGLYVTFELIRVMGGHLWINSRVGEGTTFTFSMPIHKGEDDKQFDQTFDQDSNRNREHISINEPAPTNPNPTGNMLTIDGSELEGIVNSNTNESGNSEIPKQPE